MSAEPDKRRIVRVLKAVGSAASARLEPISSGEAVLLRFDDGRALKLQRDFVTLLLRSGWLKRTGGDDAKRVSLTTDGRSFLARCGAGGDFAAQHRAVKRPGSSAHPVRNDGESPLTRLARSKGGRAFIGRTQLDAGERLRIDFEQSQLRQRVTASWDLSHVARRGSGQAGGGDLSDQALDARQRFHRALDAVGPEFAGLLVDVCCFLKGLEQVEGERGWPRRSAKVLLGAALRALDRHYNPPFNQGSGRQRHWGAEDYRPGLGGV